MVCLLPPNGLSIPVVFNAGSPCRSCMHLIRHALLGTRHWLVMRRSSAQEGRERRTLWRRSRQFGHRRLVPSRAQLPAPAPFSAVGSWIAPSAFAVSQSHDCHQMNSEYQDLDNYVGGTIVVLPLQPTVCGLSGALEQLPLILFAPFCRCSLPGVAWLIGGHGC
jgi:hypothetical protein